MPTHEIWSFVCYTKRQRCYGPTESTHETTQSFQGSYPLSWQVQQAAKRTNSVRFLCGNAECEVNQDNAWCTFSITSMYFTKWKCCIELQLPLKWMMFYFVTNWMKTFFFFLVVRKAHETAGACLSCGIRGQDHDEILYIHMNSKYCVPNLSLYLLFNLREVSIAPEKVGKFLAISNWFYN